MKRFMVYWSLMDRQNKTSRILNILLVLFAVIIVGIHFISKIIPLSIFVVYIIIVGLIILISINSTMFVCVCRNIEEKIFKNMFFLYIDAETYKQTQQECPQFTRIRNQILIHYVKKNNIEIKNLFAYLKNWQNNHLMFYNI